MPDVPAEPARSRLSPLQWLICAVAALGFLFDWYELLMLPLIVRPALSELLNVAPTDPAVNNWAGILFSVPAVAGGIFGLLGGYLTDLLGRRRVLVWSILLYAAAAFGAGFATSVPELPLLALLRVRRRLCGVRRRRRLALRAVSRSETARSRRRLHPGLRIDRRRPGHGCLLSDRHLRGRSARQSTAARRRGGIC